MQKDTVFKAKHRHVPKFEFNEQVAAVFDDMVSRSIPFYHEIHRMLLDLMAHKLKDGDLVYDLGCSLGTTLSLVHDFARENDLKEVRLVGVDSSPNMIERASERFAERGVPGELICTRIEDLELEKCGVVIMNYTLQFIPARRRKALVRKIHRALRPGGIFILAEKIKSPNPAVQELITEMYYDFKRRNGYSELEIAQKRQALEDVLVPWTEKRQLQMLADCGFKKSETLFRWYNFASFIGIK